MSAHILKVGNTSKGRRIWLQTTERYGWNGGDRYTTRITKTAITLTKDPEGKRKVTPSKSGVIDLCNNTITEWADGCQQVSVRYTEDTITIRRA